VQYSRDFALLLIDLTAAAYALAQGQPYTLPPGFAPAVPIRIAVGAVPELLEHDALPIWGLSTECDGQQYIAFRGTQDWPEWVADFVSLPLRFGAHFGFHAIYEAIRASVAVDQNSIITGHSLGAAIAAICYANDGGGQLMTFACPHVGDAGFADSLEGTLRLENDYDIIPALPLAPLFRHGGTRVRVSGPGSLWDARLAHRLASYRAGALAGK
jgi:hypothetical protein